MAGPDHHSLHLDPALEKWSKMSMNRHKYFRWTRRTAGLAFAYVIVVPAIFGIMGYTTDGKWDFRGKRRGDTIVEF